MPQRPMIAPRLVYLVVLTACFALPVIADKHELKPVPAQGQTAVTMKEKHFVEQTKDGIKVVAEGYATGEVFTANIGIENDSKSPIPVEQERFFALNGYDRILYRVPDYEVSATLAWAADQPPPPPPPPRHYYTLRADSYGHYSGDISLDYKGDGYVSLNGYSHTYGEIQEHYERDPAETLGYLVGATIRKAIERRRYRKAIEEVDKSYFRNSVIQPGQFANGVVIFRAVNVSNRAPFKAVLFVQDTKFQFVFEK